MARNLRGCSHKADTTRLGQCRSWFSIRYQTEAKRRTIRILSQANRKNEAPATARQLAGCNSNAAEGSVFPLEPEDFRAKGDEYEWPQLDVAALCGIISDMTES